MKWAYTVLVGILLIFAASTALGIKSSFLAAAPAGAQPWLLTAFISLGAGAILLGVLTALALKAQGRTEQAAFDHKQDLRQVLEAADLAAWDWDIITDRTVVNERWATMLGYSRADLPKPSLGEFWQSHIHPEDSQRVLNALQRHISGETERYEAEYRMQTKNGEWLWILARGQAISRDSDGRATRITGTHLDISARKQIEQRLGAAMEAAEAAGRAKDQFLAVISHEIRTPLNSVLGLSELMLATSLDAQQQGYMRQLQSSGRSLMRLIEDVLDFAKIESGQLQLENTEFNLRELLNQTVRQFAEQARVKKISLTAQLPKNTPAIVRGDAKRLRQVLSNLISNAISHTDQGSVSVRLSDMTLSNSQVHLRFEVADTGVGISSDQQRHIFDEFVQIDSTTRRRHSGTGLGLATCKHLVALMGGAIQVSSEPGKGSTFSFTASLERVAEKPVLKDSNARQPVEPKTTRVLIAEDNLVNLELVGQMMQLLGCQVDSAEDGRAAVAACEQQHYDLVLMDLRMPEMDGFDATIEIRRREQGQQHFTPIVALTADVVPGVAERCRQIGMDDYLSKPVTIKQLRETLVRWVPGYVNSKSA